MHKEFLMKSRRAMLSALGFGLSGLALAAVASPGAPQARKASPRGGRASHAWRMPQAVVQDQDGREFKFYDDLIKDKLVLISFASVDGEKRFPIVDNLVKVQQMVRDRLGKDLFIYTVTTKPQVDTPAALKAFAEKKGARWQFLTGKAEEIAQIKKTLGVMGSIHGLLWIGNDRSGRWLSKPARLQPLFISESLAFLSTGAQHKQFLKDMRSVKS
jgi:protein SCO1/2